LCQCVATFFLKHATSAQLGQHFLEQNRTHIAQTHAYSVTTNDTVRKSNQDLSRINTRFQALILFIRHLCYSSDAIGVTL
jgi:hypothetical protein